VIGRTKPGISAAFILVAAVAVGSCASAEVSGKAEEPIEVVEIAGTDLWRLTLSASAAERLDIQTAAVESADGVLVVPSAAVIIDPEGTYWVYTSPEPLVYIRHEIRPVREEGLKAFFEAGPEVGTTVVTVGVPELFGAEFGIGK